MRRKGFSKPAKNFARDFYPRKSGDRALSALLGHVAARRGGSNEARLFTSVATFSGRFVAAKPSGPFLYVFYDIAVTLSPPFGIFSRRNGIAGARLSLPPVRISLPF